MRNLAGQFGVPPGKLEEEFQDHHRLAQSEKNRRPQLTSAQAWQAALAKSQATWQTRHNMPASALLPAAERYFVSPGPTAGVERIFSWFKRFAGEQWHATELVEERLLVLTQRAHHSPELPPRLLRAARAVWARNFGGPRNRVRESFGIRVTLRLRSMAARSKSTGAGWLAHRREQVADEAKKVVGGLSRSLRREPAIWAEKHEEEVRHQREERLERACAAVEEGEAAESVASAEARRHWTAAERKRAKDTADGARRKAAAHAVPAGRRIHGEAVFLATGARQALDKPLGTWARLRNAGALREVSEQDRPSVVVALDPTKPGDRVMVQAGILGQTVCSPSYLASGTGPLLQLQCTVRKHRFICVSVACAAKHGPMLAFMRQSAQRANGNRWRFMGPAPDEAKIFLSRAGKRAAAHNSEIVALVAPEEKGAATLARYPRTMTLRAFAQGQIWQTDAARPQIGCCGR